MKTNKTQLQGFTLIEMMLVVAIIGILAALALPAYQTYTIRAKIVETTNFSGAAKTLLWEEYFTVATMPEITSNAAKSVENMMMASKYISNATYRKIDANNASLQVTFQNLGMDANGSTMIFLFQTNSNIITLDCKGGTLADIYRPAFCHSNN